MLGLRGVRLLLVHPEVAEVQIRALAEAVARLAGAGPERPTRGHAAARRRGRRADRRARAHRGRHRRGRAERHGRAVDIPVGVMIELPRAALTAGDAGRPRGLLLLRHERPDADDLGHLPGRRGGELPRALPGAGHHRQRPVRDARRGGRRGARQGGGEEGPPRPGRTSSSGSAASTPATPRRSAFFAAAGIDYLSCSPPRVPVARLEAGRQAVLTGGGGRATSDTR